MSKSKPSLWKGIHWAAGGAFRRLGFEWEVRRSGDLEIGMWKIRFSQPRKGVRAHPRRFVLLPGFGDTPLSWLAVLCLLRPVLKRRFDEVILVAFPGFPGFLSRKRSIHSMDLLVTATSDLFDSLKPHTIFGHSLGGWLAATYAAACGEGSRPASPAPSYAGPEMVILANPSGVCPSREDLLAWQAKFASAIEEGFGPYRPLIFAREPLWFPLVAGDFREFFAKADIVQFMLSIRDDHNLESRLHRIRARTWLLWGEDDRLVPSHWARSWIEGISPAHRADSPPAKAVLIRGAGHSPHVEKPAVTAAILTQILTGRVPHLAGKRWWKVVEI